MKLISQAREYVEKPYNPGNILKRFVRKANLDISMLEIAQTIVNADQNRNLCSQDLVNFKQIVKSTKNHNGDIINIEL